MPSPFPLQHITKPSILYYCKESGLKTMWLLELSVPAGLHKSRIYFKNVEREKGRKFGMQICVSKTREQQTQLQCIAC